MAKNGKGSAPGKFMDSGVGLCAYKSNPMKQPNRMAYGTGPGMNADQRKADKLLKKAWAEKESLRGKSGM